MLRLSVLCLLFIILCSCSPASSSSPPAMLTPTVPFTEIPSLTSTPTITPTKTLVPTSTEKHPAQDVWQLSPDGHIYYNEAQLYGGLFTIDKEHPEYAKKYWEDTVRGLWNLQFITKDSKVENTAFINQFSTPEKLLDWINAGNLVDNLWIPVIYPTTDYIREATLEPITESIDLSQTAFAIDKPSLTEITQYNPSPNKTKYISYYGAAEQVYIEKN